MKEYMELWKEVNGELPPAVFGYKKLKELLPEFGEAKLRNLARNLSRSEKNESYQIHLTDFLRWWAAGETPKKRQWLNEESRMVRD